MHEPWQSALRLQLTPGLGLRRARALVQHLGGCEPALDAPDALLRDALGTGLWSSDRKSTRLNSSHSQQSRMPSSA